MLGTLVDFCVFGVVVLGAGGFVIAFLVVEGFGDFVVSGGKYVLGNFVTCLVVVTSLVVGLFVVVVTGGR